MKKIVDFAEIEAREKELLEELAILRNFKKYATKFGADYDVSSSQDTHSGQSTSGDDAIGAVRLMVLELATTNFNNQDIEKALLKAGHSFSRSSVFEAISKLKSLEEIEVVEKGAGRRPAKYKITDKFTPF